MVKVNQKRAKSELNALAILSSILVAPGMDGTCKKQRLPQLKILLQKMLIGEIVFCLFGKRNKASLLLAEVCDFLPLD